MPTEGGESSNAHDLLNLAVELYDLLQKKDVSMGELLLTMQPKSGQESSVEQSSDKVASNTLHHGTTRHSFHVMSSAASSFFCRCLMIPLAASEDDEIGWGEVAELFSSELSRMAGGGRSTCCIRLT